MKHLLSIAVYFFFSLHVNGKSNYPLCPNECSRQGTCKNTGSYSQCECFPGFVGTDCSLRYCPAAKAWVDFPAASNTAHADYTECSNMGICDRQTGICNCRQGFSGAACDIMLCPTGTLTGDSSVYPTLALSTALAPCSGKGTCMSLREVSEFQDYDTYLGYTSYSTEWDADMIHACVCEKGWEGVACNKRTCPKGDDPTTAGVDKIQLIDCQCAQCAGGIYLTYENFQTPLIPYDASEELIWYRLQNIPGLEAVEVRFLQTPLTATGSHPDQMCSNTGTITEVTFKLPQNTNSKLTLTNAGGNKNTILTGLHIGIRTDGEPSALASGVRSYRSTREHVECSNHGRCNHNEGVCECYDGYKSSDGMGGHGTRGDCGYQYQEYNNYTSYATVKNSTDNTTELMLTRIYSKCPFEYNALCSGNGTCNELTGQCGCNTGYSGPACSNRTCGSTTAWFGNVLADHAATAVCGGVGECDGGTGKCRSCGGDWGYFTGDRCETLGCYSDVSKGPCNGNGVCLTLKELAPRTYNNNKELAGVTYTIPWDADLIRGCACDRAISVDNQFNSRYTDFPDEFGYNETTLETISYYSEADQNKFYRGPYAYAATDFTGYNCINALCPKGDNPRTIGYNEVQKLDCIADNGTFTLTFRENTTLPIAANTTAYQLKVALEQLYTIGEVDVSILIDGYEKSGEYLNRTVCSIFSNNSVLIEFMTETGDLPLLIPEVQNLKNIHSYIDQIPSDSFDWYLMNITEFVAGTKEDIECSGQGTCDYATGVCTCVENYGSSDGSTSKPGQRGDCSFMNKFIKV